ncbi:MAG: hypothetical protein IJ356_09045 [Erysipelotrichaceae bacterium]|nr:hypothetical protein [Erysipelotrichaceae bacterium]
MIEIISRMLMPAVLAPFVSNSFTVETMMIGAVTGWSAVGLNKTIKQSRE